MKTILNILNVFFFLFILASCGGGGGSKSRANFGGSEIGNALVIGHVAGNDCEVETIFVWDEVDLLAFSPDDNCNFSLDVPANKVYTLVFKFKDGSESPLRVQNDQNMPQTYSFFVGDEGISINLGEVARENQGGPQALIMQFLGGGVDLIPENQPAKQTDIDKDGTVDFFDADDDGDGLEDKSDNCPFVSNADQKDSDHDGQGDVCDNNLDFSECEVENPPTHQVCDPDTNKCLDFCDLKYL